MRQRLDLFGVLGARLARAILDEQRAQTEVPDPYAMRAFRSFHAGRGAPAGMFFTRSS
jgi:hypothetical protein